MAEMTEQTERRRIRALTFKGTWYIITGAGLQVFMATILGVLIDTLSPTASEHPIIAGLIIWTIFLIGVAWGGIFMWKGFNIIPPKKSRR